MNSILPLISQINARLSANKNTSLKKPYAKSCIFLSNEFFFFFKSNLGDRTNILTLDEQQKLNIANSSAYDELAKLAITHQIPIECVVAIEPLLKGDERRELGIRTGLCYDCKPLFDLALQGRTKEVQEIARKDYFLMKTLCVWCIAESANHRNGGNFMAQDEINQIKKTFDSVISIKNPENLKFPDINLKSYKTAKKEEVSSLLEKDLSKIKSAIKKVNTEEEVL